MGKSMFTIKGNVCSERVRLGRALQKPPITQEELAKKLQFMGMEDMTPLIISRILKAGKKKSMLYTTTMPNSYPVNFPQKSRP